MLIKMFSYFVLVISICFFEGWKMRKNKQTKEILVYFVIVGISSIAYVCFLLQIPIPNPLNGIKFLFEPIGLAVDRFLGDASS